MDKVKQWIRQSQVWGFAAGVAVMALIALAFFYPDNIDGNSLRQPDMIQGMANGQEAKAFYEETGEQAFWTDALFGGMPTFQISPSYPSNSLFTWLNSVYGLWLPAPSNLLFMMMFGFFILMYAMRFRWYYSLIGAVAWGFSSYFIIIIGAGHIWKFVTLSYIPPTIAGVMLAYRGRYLAGGALTALFAMMQLNANHPQMTYYFGLVIFALIVAWLVEAIREKKVRNWAVATAVTVAAGGLAVGANLPSLYNTYEYAKETKRSQSELTPLANAKAAGTAAERPTGGMAKSEILAYSYGQSETFSLLIPNIKGGATIKPEKGIPHRMGLGSKQMSENLRAQNFYTNPLDGAEEYDSLPISQLLPYLPQYFNDSEGTNGPVYVGAIICVLFLLGCVIVKGPVKWALLVMTIFSILLAWGINFEWFSDLFIYHFPMYNKFRAVESILVIAEFTMPLLGLMALSRLLASPKEITAYKKPLFVCFGVCAFFALLAVFIPSAYGEAITSSEKEFIETNGLAAPANIEAIENLRYGLVIADGLRSFLLIAAFALILWIYSKGNLRKWMAVGSVGILILLDLYSVDKRYVDHESFMEITSAEPVVIEPDAIDNYILRDNDHYRVMDIPGFGAAERSYFHNMVGGYHAAKLNRYEDVIQRGLSPVLSYGYYPDLRDDSIRSLYPEDDRLIVDQLLSSYRILDMLNARYIITGESQMPLVYNPDALGPAWIVDNIKYVGNADEEMAALMSLDPAREAVADTKFSQTLGKVTGSLVPGDTIMLVNYTPNKITYRTDTKTDAIGVFSEVWFPWGWKATIDGQPAELGRVNYILRAMAIPAGQHEIVMTFDPDSLHVTGAIAYACVTIIYIMIALALFFEWKRLQPTDTHAVADDSPRSDDK